MDFINDTLNKIKELDLDWRVRGLIDYNDNIYSLGSDTKIIGRVFELIVAPVLEIIAEENGLTLKESDQQTVYPDFTLMADEDDKQKIAIDVKSTYRRGYYKQDSTKYDYKAGDPKPFGFTLGSFASFLRNNTKNILYPYDSYSRHYVIGFVYSRIEEAQKGNIKKIANRHQITAPYNEVSYFIQEKWKIAGLKPGSGNTENIGSFQSNNIKDFQNGLGPFSDHGKEVFEDYWRNYGKYRSKKSFKNLDQYFKWKNNKN